MQPLIFTNIQEKSMNMNKKKKQKNKMISCIIENDKKNFISFAGLLKVYFCSYNTRIFVRFNKS